MNINSERVWSALCTICGECCAHFFFWLSAFQSHIWNTIESTWGVPTCNREAQELCFPLKVIFGERL